MGRSRTSMRAAEYCLIRAVDAYRRGDQSDGRLYLGAANRLAEEALSTFPPKQVAAVRAYHDAHPDYAAAIRECLAASRAEVRE